MLKAAIYARKLSDDLPTIDEQIRKCSELVRKDGVDNIIEYIDDNTFKRVNKRIGLLSLLNDLPELNINVLLVYSKEVLSSKNNEQLSILESIESHNVAVRYVQPEYDPTCYAAIYARRSNKNESFSTESQIEDCKQMIKQEGLLLYKAYMDNETGSANYKKRKEFINLLNDLYAGLFKTLVVVRMDRLTRRIDDFFKIQDILKRHNVRIIYVKEPELNISDKSYMSGFLKNIFMSLSTLEPARIEEKTKQGRKRKREKGYYDSGIYAPYGLERPDKSNYTVIEELEDIVKEVFDIYSYFIDKVGKVQNDGMIFKMSDLVNEISKLDIKDRKISKGFIEGIIERPVYAKLYRVDEKIPWSSMLTWDESKGRNTLLKSKNLISCENIDRAILDEEYWDEVMVKKIEHDIQSKKSPQIYLLKDLLKCGTCNTNIKYYNDLYYYTCSKECVKMPSDKLLKDILTQLILDVNTKDIKSMLKIKIRDVEAQIKKVQRQIYKNQNDRRRLIRILIQDPHDTTIINQYKENTSLEKEFKNDINRHGKALRVLEDRVEAVDIFRMQMADSINTIDIVPLLVNWMPLHHLIENLVERIIIKKLRKEIKSQIEIQYVK